jgi:hypothetical protein
MRIFVFLLVLANLIFFAWTQGYIGQAESPDAARLSQQFAGDRLRIVSRDQPPPVTMPPPPAKKAEPEPEKCLAWSGLSAADADAAEAALAGERFATLRRVRHSEPEPAGWWVFMPPQASKAEADKKASELKKLGVTDFFIIQEAGPNRFAISLGIFSSEQAAEDQLKALRAKGVRSARTGQRTVVRSEHVSVEASGPESLLEPAREAVFAALPAVKSAACGKR